MIDMCPLLLSDTYKQTHDRMYPKNLEYLTSYLVPRKSMLAETDEMVFFGIKAFVDEYLCSYFNRNFFSKSLEEVLGEYQDVMDVQLGRGNYDIQKVVDLHRLGYLPLVIKALPEGTRVPMAVPCVELTNSVAGYAWLVQWVECLLQTELWKICNHATIADMYLQCAKKWYEKTTDGADPREACADFGFRGMSCVEEATKCSAAWLTAFNKTSTIPALRYITKHYGSLPDGVGRGGVSTEHSVMCANFSVDGDEITFVKKLLTQLYPDTSFSMVSDSYDYWNMVKTIIPACKPEIFKHNGKLLIRPDSGDMRTIAPDTVQSLWDTFGGTINSKGYKVLDPHIGVIYGDGCTLRNVDHVWSELERRGFSATNVVFGVGAFCFTSMWEGDRLIVNSRDTFGMAMKATHGKLADGTEIDIFKDPKTDPTGLKKSLKGLVCVVRDKDTGKLKAVPRTGVVDYTLLHTIYNGCEARSEYFKTIRERLKIL